MENNVEKILNEALNNAINKINEEYEKASNIEKENTEKTENITKQDIKIDAAKIIEGADLLIVATDSNIVFSGNKKDILTMLTLIMSRLIEMGVTNTDELDKAVRLAAIPNDKLMLDLISNLSNLFNIEN